MPLMESRRLAIAWGLILASLSLAPGPRAPDRPAVSDVRVVLKASDAGRLRLDRYIEADGPYWTPGEQEIKGLESELVPYLRSHTFGVHERELVATVAERWPAYHRQYVGYTQKGRRLVYLNAFCDREMTTFPEWRNTFVYVNDGGPCFFHVSYDPASRRIVEVAVNGYA